MIPGAQCGTCVFFSRNPREPDIGGQCRHSAPRLTRDGNGTLRSMWPMVKAEWWCGDHAVEAVRE